MDSKYTKYIIRGVLLCCGILLVFINLLTFFEGIAHEHNILAWHIVLSTMQTVILLFIALQWSQRHVWILSFLGAFIMPEIVRLSWLWSGHTTLAGRLLLGVDNLIALSVTFICFILLSSIILQIVQRMNILRQRMEYKKQLLSKLIDTLPVAISVDLPDGQRPVFNSAAHHSAEKNDGIFTLQEGKSNNFVQRLWQELDERAATHELVGQLFHHNKVSDDAYQLYDVGYGLLDVPARNPHTSEKQEHLFIYAIDISEREKLIHDLKQSKQEAQTANEAKTRFLANVSHELRTPITSIVGFAEYLRYYDKGLDRDVMDSINMIAESGETLLQLVNDILDLSKAESHKLVDNAAKVAVHSLVYDEIQMIHEKVKEKKLELRTLLSFDLPEQVIIDVGKVKQIVRNLLSNAYKFTQAGMITITVWSSDILTWKHSQHSDLNTMTLLDCLSLAQEHPPQQEDEVVLHIEVSDTGVGIATDELDTIFEPFIQSQSGRQSGGGTGLGLTICQQLVDFLGGKITISSAPHKGTSCHFYVRAKRASQQRNLEDVGVYLARHASLRSAS